MIITYIVVVIVCIFVSGMIGVAFGYSQGYEDRMLETMSKKQKADYLIKKQLNDIRQIK